MEQTVEELFDAPLPTTHDTAETVNQEVERIKKVLSEKNVPRIINGAVDRIWKRSGANDQPKPQWPFWWIRSAMTKLLPIVATKTLEGKDTQGHGDLLFSIGIAAEMDQYLATSDRYMLLALIYDLIFQPDAKLSTFSGAYLHLVKRGVTDTQVEQIRALVKGNPAQKLPDIFFPKALLIATTLCRALNIREMQIVESNDVVAKYLYDLTESTTATTQDKGRHLEEFIGYSLSTINGFIPRLHLKSSAKEYDILCEVAGSQDGFRAEIGRHILGEAKNTKTTVPTHVAHRLDSLLDSSTIRLGLIVGRAAASREMKLELTRIRNKQRHLILYLTTKEIYDMMVAGTFLSSLKDQFDQRKLNLDWLKP